MCRPSPFLSMACGGRPAYPSAAASGVDGLGTEPQPGPPSASCHQSGLAPCQAGGELCCGRPQALGLMKEASEDHSHCRPRPAPARWPVCLKLRVPSPRGNLSPWALSLCPPDLVLLGSQGPPVSACFLSCHLFPVTAAQCHLT